MIKVKAGKENDIADDTDSLEALREITAVETFGDSSSDDENVLKR